MYILLPHTHHLLHRALHPSPHSRWLILTLPDSSTYTSTYSHTYTALSIYTDSLTHRLTHGLTRPSTYTRTHWLTHTLTHPPTHTNSHKHTDPLFQTLSLTHTHTDPPTNPDSPTHTDTTWPTYSLHSLAHTHWLTSGCGSYRLISRSPSWAWTSTSSPSFSTPHPPCLFGCLFSYDCCR